jgi:triosephosphate isomerase
MKPKAKAKADQEAKPAAKAKPAKKKAARPIILVNFKAYKEATGREALMLAKIHASVARRARSRANIMIAPQTADIYRISHAVPIPVLGQHADQVEYGAHTGCQLPECLKENGAWGCIINHSERRMQQLKEIGVAIKRCRDAGLKTVVCAESITKAFEIAKMQPDYLAFEDPSLIGTGRSVSKNKPESVRKFAETVEKANEGRSHKTVPLCGAGVSDREDVEKAVELGTKGVLLASGIIKSRDPKKALENLVGL